MDTRTWTPTTPNQKNWDFKPGAANLKSHTATQLGDYMKKYEPNSTLTFPGGPSGKD